MKARYQNYEILKPQELVEYVSYSGSFQTEMKNAKKLLDSGAYVVEYPHFTKIGSRVFNYKLDFIKHCIENLKQYGTTFVPKRILGGENNG